jgi:hypothetical protein
VSLDKCISLKEVKGSFTLISMFCWTKLPNFDGLINLKSIGKSFELAFDCNSIDFSGLRNLTFIGENLSIDGRQKEVLFPSLQMSWLNGNLRINCPNLEQVNLGTIDSIHGNVYFWANKITNLGALRSLKHVSGSFNAVLNHESSNPYEGLNNLVTIGNGLSISGSNMTTLEPFRKLNQLGGRLSINLTNLESLEGLNNIKSGITSFIVTQNPNLIDFCAIDNSVFSNVNGITNIWGNKYNPTLEDLVDGNCSQ